MGKFDGQWLDSMYNIRARVPEHPEHFRRWAGDSADMRRSERRELDVRYGGGPNEHLDVFPADEPEAPVLVFIHGGYWRALDKSDFSWIAPPFVNHGMAVALLNYGLAPATPIEDIVRQMLRAHAWLYRSADRYGYDPNRIFVTGHSAGAHLTAMMMAALWPAYAADLPANLVKGGLAVSGIFDLEPLVYAPFVNADLQLNRTRAQRVSPARMPPATDAPLITAAGALESGEFKRQSELLDKAWRRNFVRHVEVADAHHLAVCDELANPASPLFDAALDLIHRRGLQR